MKIKYPEAAIVDNHPEAGSLLEKSIKDNIPCCKVDTFHSFAEFPRRSKYSLVVVDSVVLPEDKVRGLKQLRGANPYSKIVMAGDSTTKEVLGDIINEDLLAGYIVKPGNKEELDSMAAKFDKLLLKLRRQGVFTVDFSILVIGGGVLGREMIRALTDSNDKWKVGWYSKSLSTREYLHSGTGEFSSQTLKFGYPELMQSAGIFPTNNLECYNNLEEALNSKPGIIIVASSMPTKDIVLPYKKEEREGIAQALFENAMPRTIELLDIMSKTDSDASLVFFSNPPGSLAYISKILGFEADKTTISSGDKPRLERILLDIINRTNKKKDISNISVQAFPIGSHLSPNYVPALCSVRYQNEEGMFVTENICDFNPEFGMSTMIVMVNEHLKIYAGMVMENYLRAIQDGRVIPYTDAVRPTAAELRKLRKMQPVSLGRYYPELDAFMLGLPSAVDYSRLSFHSDSKNALNPYFLSIENNQKMIDILKEPLNIEKKLALDGARSAGIMP